MTTPSFFTKAAEATRSIRSLIWQFITRDESIGFVLGVIILSGIATASISPGTGGVPKFANEKMSLVEIWFQPELDTMDVFALPFKMDSTGSISLNLRTTEYNPTTKEFYQQPLEK